MQFYLSNIRPTSHH